RSAHTTPDTSAGTQAAAATHTRGRARPTGSRALLRWLRRQRWRHHAPRGSRRLFPLLVDEPVAAVDGQRKAVLARSTYASRKARLPDASHAPLAAALDVPGILARALEDVAAAWSK